MAYTQGSDSDDPRALSIKQHPDWFTSTPKLDPEGHINWDALIDLGYDPARDWAEQATQRVVSEYKLDYFKTDYTPIVTKCEQTNHRHHYGVDVSYWSTLGYYASAGGADTQIPRSHSRGMFRLGIIDIKDFGDIQRVHMIAMNDTSSSLPNRQGTYDSTFAISPRRLNELHLREFLRHVLRRPGSLFLAVFHDERMVRLTRRTVQAGRRKQRAGGKRATDIYKSWVHPILQDVEVH